MEDEREEMAQGIGVIVSAKEHILCERGGQRVDGREDEEKGIVGSCPCPEAEDDCPGHERDLLCETDTRCRMIGGGSHLVTEAV